MSTKSIPGACVRCGSVRLFTGAPRNLPQCLLQDCARRPRPSHALALVSVDEAALKWTRRALRPGFKAPMLTDRGFLAKNGGTPLASDAAERAGDLFGAGNYDDPDRCADIAVWRRGQTDLVRMAIPALAGAANT